MELPGGGLPPEPETKLARAQFGLGDEGGPNQTLPLGYIVFELDACRPVIPVVGKVVVVMVGRGDVLGMPVAAPIPDARHHHAVVPHKGGDGLEWGACIVEGRQTREIRS